ncbi:MAG: hypothetical protein KDC24_11235 [Saprospiraceae bacterium]|nr:hypothetical protein [Saprospiraceae bacterium]
MKALLPTFLTLSLLFSAATLPAQVRNYTTQQSELPCLDKTFSVVLHVLKDTFGNINVQLADFNTNFNELNTAFEPICARFEICETRFIDNFQYDILSDDDEWQEMLVKEHKPNRINLFLVAESFLEDLRESGFATPNGIAELETGGIVVVKNSLGPDSKTLQHLMGHYFGLLHTFENAPAELVNGTNCDTEGDLICDTPADPYRLGDDPASYLDTQVPCRFTLEELDDNGEYFRPDVGNYMSYYPEACRCGYTYEQYLKMANNYLTSSPKMW